MHPERREVISILLCNAGFCRDTCSSFFIMLIIYIRLAIWQITLHACYYSINVARNDYHGNVDDDDDAAVVHHIMLWITREYACDRWHLANGIS